jgi:hypothetical protein
MQDNAEGKLDALKIEIDILIETVDVHADGLKTSLKDNKHLCV